LPRVGLSPTGVLDICKHFAAKAKPGLIAIMDAPTAIDFSVRSRKPRTRSGAFTLLVAVRCRTGEIYADGIAPAIQVMAMEATEQ
jgi:hypothetical protein